MTGKQRAAFRAKANSLVPLFQIGKGGINEALVKQTDDALTARELIKIKVLLESTPISPREAADELSAKTGSEVIQVIGGVIVLYRENPEIAQKAKEKEQRQKKMLREQRMKALREVKSKRKSR